MQESNPGISDFKAGSFLHHSVSAFNEQNLYLHTTLRFTRYSCVLTWSNKSSVREYGQMVLTTFLQKKTLV